MPNYVASYSLKETNPKPHATFLKHATRLGWAHSILSRTNIWHKLPGATLIGKFDDIDIALKSFDAAATAASAELKSPIVVEKLIIAEYLKSRLRSNEKQPKK
jgi:hypothetical protein